MAVLLVADWAATLVVQTGLKTADKWDGRLAVVKAVKKVVCWVAMKVVSMAVPMAGS